MLCRDHDGRDSDRLAVFVFDRHLALAVRPQPIDEILLSAFGQAIDQAVSEGDRHRHKLRSLIAGVAEHQALVAGSVAVHAHGDVTALTVQAQEDSQ